MDISYILLSVSIVIFISHFFDDLAKQTRIPSVVFLLLTGISLKEITYIVPFHIPYIEVILPTIGNVALMLIVLEGALELHVSREKIEGIRRAFFASISILLLCSLLLAIAFVYTFKVTFFMAFMNAIPFAVISSAIAIPSAGGLSKPNKEFVIYESSFSDILGILLFNFFLAHPKITVLGTLSYISITALTVILAFLIAVLLLFYLKVIKKDVKFVPIFAAIAVIYSLAKIYHLSPLILVLIFGLIMNNTQLLSGFRLSNYFPSAEVNAVLPYFTRISGEAVFLIKTIFFVLFGYSIQIREFLDPYTLGMGFAVFTVIVLSRWILIPYFTFRRLSPLLYFAPRGLITILLFISIPEENKIALLNQSIVVITIILSIVFMLIARDKKVTHLIEQIPH